MEPPISKQRRKKWRLESVPDLNLGLDELYPGGERTPTLDQVLGREAYTLTPPIELQAGPAIIERRGEPRLQLEADPAIIEQRGEAPRGLTDLLPPWQTGLARETRLPEGIDEDTAPLRDMDIEKILLGDEEGPKTPEERDSETMEEAQQARSGTTKDAIEKVRANVSESLERDLDPLRNLDLTSILDAQQKTDPASEDMPPPIGMEPVEVEAGRKYLDPVEVEAGRKYLDPVEVRAGEDYSGDDPLQLDPVEVEAGRDYAAAQGDDTLRLDPVEVRAGEDYSQPEDDGTVRLDPVEVEAGADYNGKPMHPPVGASASGGMTAEVTRTPGTPGGPSSPPPPQQTMPPPIEDPRRRNVGRSRAFSVVSAMASPITGHDRYQESLDRQNAEANRDYALDVDRYNRQVTERDKMRAQGIEDYERLRKYSERDRAIPDGIRMALSEHYGVEVPAGTTIQQWDDYTRNGMNAIGANRIQGQRDAAAAAAAIAEKDRARALDQQNRIDLVRERARYKKGKGGGKGGGGGGAGLGGAGRRAFQLSQAVGDAVMAEQGFGGEGAYKDALQDIRYGFPRTKAAQAVASAVGNDEIKEAVKLAESQGKAYASRTAQNARKITGYYDVTADERAGLKAWDDYKRTHSPEQIRAAFRGVTGKSSKAWTKDERTFVAAMRRPIASFLRQMTGAAMTPAELGLHAGQAGGLLVQSDDQWASVGGLAKALENYLTKANAQPGEVMSLIERVREKADQQMRAMVRGAPIAALRAMPKDNRQAILEGRVMDALDAGLERPYPGARVQDGSVRLDNYRIRFQWEDGTPGEVLDE